MVGQTFTKVKFEDKYVVKIDEIQNERFGSSSCGPLSEVPRFGDNLRLSYLGQRIWILHFQVNTCSIRFKNQSQKIIRKSEKSI